MVRNIVSQETLSLENDHVSIIQTYFVFSVHTERGSPLYTLLVARTFGIHKVAVNSSVTPPVFGRPYVLINNCKLYQIIRIRQSHSSGVLQIQKENLNYEIDNILVIH